MRNEVVTTARRIRGEVHIAENHYDMALAGNARLVASLLEGRVNAGVPAKTGREAIDKALEAISHGVRARETMLEAHEQLAQLNLRELGVGDVVPCPEDWTKGSANVVPLPEQRAA